MLFLHHMSVRLCNTCLKRSLQLWKFQKPSRHIFTISALWSHYKTLRVKQNATKEEIKAAYIELTKKHHPDAKSLNDSDTQEFLKVSFMFYIGSADILLDFQVSQSNRGHIKIIQQYGNKPEFSTVSLKKHRFLYIFVFFYQITEAYKILSDSSSRTRYDITSFGMSHDFNRFSSGEYELPKDRSEWSQWFYEKLLPLIRMSNNLTSICIFRLQKKENGG